MATYLFLLFTKLLNSEGFVAENLAVRIDDENAYYIKGK
jgi:hypothetical protein